MRSVASLLLPAGGAPASPSMPMHPTAKVRLGAAVVAMPVVVSLFVESLLAPFAKGKALLDSAAAAPASSSVEGLVATAAVAESAPSAEADDDEEESAVDDDAFDDASGSDGGGTGSVKMGRNARTTRLVCPSVVLDTTTCARRAHGT